MMLVSEKNSQNIHCIFMLPIMGRLFQYQSKKHAIQYSEKSNYNIGKTDFDYAN